MKNEKTRGGFEAFELVRLEAPILRAAPLNPFVVKAYVATPSGKRKPLLYDCLGESDEGRDFDLLPSYLVRAGVVEKSEQLSTRATIGKRLKRRRRMVFMAESGPIAKGDSMTAKVKMNETTATLTGSMPSGRSGDKEFFLKLLNDEVLNQLSVMGYDIRGIEFKVPLLKKYTPKY